MRALIPMRRFRRRALSRSILTFFTLAALAVMALSPIVDQIAMAQVGDQAEEAEQGEDSVQPTEPAPEPPPPTEAPPDVVEEPAVEPTEAPPDAEPTEAVIATETAVVESFQLTVSVYRCDHPTFDPYFSSNAQMVLDQCVGQGSGDFSVESTIPVPSQSGSALTFEIGFGLTIQEQLQPGYDDPIANCFLLDANGVAVDQIGPGEANGGFWKVGSTQGDVHCDWYQVDQGSGDVYIVNMACPGPLGFPAPTMSELVTICTEPAGPILFGVQHGQIQTQTGTSGGEFNDVFFDNVQTGPIAIWAEAPAQFESARVFCQVNTVAGVELVPFAEVPAPDFRVTSLTLGHDQRLHCAWFNIAEGPGLALPDDPTPTPEPVLEQPDDSGFGTVAVNVHACPDGIAAYSLDMYEMAAQCQADPGSVDFTVASNNAYSQTVAATGGGNYASFSEVPEGPVTVTGVVPAGHGTPIVFCKLELELDLSDILPTQQVPVAAGATITMLFRSGHLLWCDWYNVPESASPNGAPSDFTVALYTCPAGYDPEAMGANPNLDCPPGPDGVTFTLADQDPDTVDQQATTGDTVANAAAFGTVLPGDYTVTETVPDGITSTFVLGCGGGGGVGPVPVFVDGPLDVSIPPGVIQTCPWFHIPETGEQQVIAREGTPGVAAALTGTASFTMYAYACPAGFDVATVDANPQASCTLADGISFDMDDLIDDGGGWTFGTGGDGTGYDTISELPAGTYIIDEGVRNGTTATFAWDCYDAAGASGRTDPLVMGSQLTYDLADGAQVRCDWFNVIGGTGRVIVNSHACGILVPAYTLAYELLGTQCTEDPGTIDYTVVSDTFQETQPASQNPLALASFANVPSGYVYAGADLPDGWGTPIVYCQVLIEDGTQVSPPAPMDMVGGSSVGFPLEPGQVVSCDWFNVIGGFVDVHVTKYACPDDFDPYAADLTSLVVTCTADPGIIDFTVEGSPLYLQARTATAAAPASFMDVPSGQVQISEKLPAGYGLPVVYCRIDFEDGSNVVPAVRKEVGSFSMVTQALSGGQVLYCEWFNSPGGEGMVSIWKQSCPEGFDAQTATRLELELRCNEPIGTVDFGLTSGSFTDIASSTNLFRYADFNAVPAGPLTIVEAPQEGYDNAVAYCRVQEPTQPVTPAKRMDVANGTLGWDLGPDQWLICRWYNAHDAGGTVTVNKFECPEGTTYDHDVGWYAENCTTPQDSIEFRLTHSGGLDPEFPVNGTVEWSNVPIGPVSIQEYLPPEYGEPVVFCGVVSSSGGPVDAVAKRVESPGGYVETRFDYPNTRYLCYWYNIPGGPGEVIVHKYTCPPGYDLHALGADPREDCPENAAGISFTIGGAAANIEDTTGGDGTVRFDGLAPGPYTVTESVPDGIEYVFVLDCYGQARGELRPYPLSMGETLAIEVGAGEAIECYWYNVPDYEGGRLTVVKYQCSTETYVSDVDCEIYENGQDFDLVYWNGDAWEYHSTQATDSVGRTTFVDLTPGEYWLDEHDREWCQMTSEEISDDGNWLNVYEGGETVVEVFNCGGDSGAQGKPGKTPAKYPNTGVP